MASYPNLSETAFAELFFQNPGRVGHLLTHRRTPTQHRLLIRTDLALPLLRGLRRGQGGMCRVAHFADLDGVLDAFESVRPMTDPPQGTNAREVLPFQDLPGTVEYSPGQKDLPALGERHHPRGNRQLNAVKVLGLPRRFPLGNHHFSQVNPHPFLNRHPRFGPELSQTRLRQQGEPNRIRRFGKDQHERIASRLDLFSVAKGAERIPHGGSPLPHEGGARLIPKSPQQRARVHHIREHQRHQTGAVPFEENRHLLR